MIRKLLEAILFVSRWVLAPFLLALALALVVLLALKMAQHIHDLLPRLSEASETDILVEILELIEVTFAGAVAVLVIFSGYENLVSRIDTARDVAWPRIAFRFPMNGKRSRRRLREEGLVRASALLGVAVLACSLSACVPVNQTQGPAAPVGALPGEPPPQPSADEQIGNGPVRVGLVLPLTQASGRSVIGTSLRNAAALALDDAGGNELTLLVKDDHSTPDGARAATEAALAEGAELVIGPLFAQNVREAARVARGAGKPMIALSTDTSTARGGVYLLSFLADSYVDHIVDYASAKGKKSIAALVPENDYGRVAEAAFLQAAARNNLRVMAVEHYQPQTLGQAAAKVAALGDQIDSLLIPEQADAMSSVSQALTSAGLDTKRVQVLGTGLWNDARVLKLPSLQGAWFAAPENGGYNAFAERYRAKFGSDPTRIATLGYDAVSLAAALAHTQGSQRYSESVITNRSGFNGADGVFRFRPDGMNERGLAVLQITNGSATSISPAPRSFTGTSSAT